MEISYSQYRSATDKVDYINGIKQEMGNLLYSKTRLMYSGMAIAASDYTHATICISEAIDDLFRYDLRDARQSIETWHHQENRKSRLEWRTEP